MASSPSMYLTYSEILQHASLNLSSYPPHNVLYWDIQQLHLQPLGSMLSLHALLIHSRQCTTTTPESNS